MKTFQQFAKAAKFFLKPSTQAVGVAIEAALPDPLADGTLKGAEKTSRNIQYRDRKQERFQNDRKSGQFTRSAAKKRSDDEKQFQKYLKNKGS